MPSKSTLSLNTIPILGSYDKVTELNVSFCNNLHNLNGLLNFKKLSYLIAEGCNLNPNLNPIKILLVNKKVSINNKNFYSYDDKREHFTLYI